MGTDPVSSTDFRRKFEVMAFAAAGGRASAKLA